MYEAWQDSIQCLEKRCTLAPSSMQGEQPSRLGNAHLPSTKLPNISRKAVIVSRGEQASTAKPQNFDSKLLHAAEWCASPAMGGSRSSSKSSSTACGQGKVTTCSGLASTVTEEAALRGQKNKCRAMCRNVRTLRSSSAVLKVSNMQDSRASDLVGSAWACAHNNIWILIL
jgi:hypothetical protein